MADRSILYAQLDRIEETLSKVVPELVAIKVDLAHHIKRSDELERKTDLLEEKINEIDKDQTRLRGFFSIGGWLLGLLATLITIIHMLAPQLVKLF